jgi:hypothetical protein
MRRSLFTGSISWADRHRWSVQRPGTLIRSMWPCRELGRPPEERQVRVQESLLPDPLGGADLDNLGILGT